MHIRNSGYFRYHPDNSIINYNFLTMKKLSKRETEIIYYLKHGFTNEMIAKELYINSKTVSTYIQRMRVKLELETWANAYKIVSTYLKNKFPNND